LHNVINIHTIRYRNTIKSVVFVAFGEFVEEIGGRTKEIFEPNEPRKNPEKSSSSQLAKMTSILDERFPAAGKKWKLRLTPVKRASNCFRLKPSQFMRTLHEFIEKHFGAPRSFIRVKL
jgi:hypothetical protein